MKRRISSMFLALVMLLSMLPGTALAAQDAPAALSAEVDSGTCGDDLTWTLDASGTLTISGTGEMTDYYYSPWNDQEESIKHVVIEDGVTSIGDYAFASCASLASVTIPNSVTSIGEWAFSNCAGLTAVTIPNSVTSINSYAFFNCTSLTKIHIPADVTDIGSSAFYGCTALTEVTVAEENLSYTAENGVLFNKEMTEIILCSKGKSGSYTIPNRVTAIGGGAFFGCTGLTDVVIPSSVTSIWS